MNETQAMTMDEFVELQGLTAEVTLTDRNPNMAEHPDPGANHWNVVLAHPTEPGFETETMSVPFTTGSALGEPSMGDVLDCLASDASGFENAQGFEDWAGDYGYDTDSRKAEATYKAVERQSRELRDFLGDEAYELLLWNTERL